jgi:hypothetical protein
MIKKNKESQIKELGINDVIGDFDVALLPLA